MNDRREQFKKSVDPEAARKGRHETSVAIRKAKKEQITNRRRMDSRGTAVAGGGEAAANGNGTQTGAMANPSLFPGGGVAGGVPGGKSGTPAILTDGLSEKMQEKLSQLPAIIEGIYSSDPTRIHECTAQIRKLLSIERKPPIEEVIATGVVPRLVDFIRQDTSHELQFEAAWALTNIASGTTAHTRVVIEAGAVPIFTKLLNSPNADVREQAIWALGNIAGDAVKYRDMVLETGAMPLLLRELVNPDNKISVLRNGTWTLSNFCRGKPAPPLPLLLPALEVLSHLVHKLDEDIITDACWALSYISDADSDKIDAVISSGVCPRLIELLACQSESVQTPALRAIGNIVTGNDQQTQTILNLGVLPKLGLLLGSRKTSIVKESCWTISNITAGIQAQIQMVIEANLIPPLVHLLSSSSAFEVRKEAAWALSNGTSGGAPEQIQYLVQSGIIRPFCNLLTEFDFNIVIVALECIENVLKDGHNRVLNRECAENPYLRLIDEAGGIDKIEDLQNHREIEVYNKARTIIEEYVGTEDPNYTEGGQAEHGFSQQPPPAQGAGGFNFNF